MATARGGRANIIVRVLGWSESRGEYIRLAWHSGIETSEAYIARVAEHFGGDGLLLDVHSALSASYDGTREAGGPQEIVVDVNEHHQKEYFSWHQAAGMLHSLVMQLLPLDRLVAFEVEPTINITVGKPTAQTGLFVLKSPGRSIWKLLMQSLRRAWLQGALGSVMVHILVHHPDDWRHQEWRDGLGEARDIFAGMHWCLGERSRYKVPKAVDDVRSPPGGEMAHSWENYFDKAFTMSFLAKSLGYKYIASFDDDVFLAASALAFLIRSGPEADREGCGVVAPLLQNGVPTVELWAEEFLGGSERNDLYGCFEEAGTHWLHLPRNSPALEPLPKPWDGPAWYRSVAAREPSDYKGVHPVRGNRACMENALSLALGKVGEQFRRWRLDHHLIVDRNRSTYPYLCNNAFLMRSDLYAEVLSRSDLFRSNGADEVPMNLLMAEKGLPLCFVSGSFGLHSAYGHHPYRDRMELTTMYVVENEHLIWKQM